MKIFKYRLHIWEVVASSPLRLDVAMPKGARILSVQTQMQGSSQRDDICIWALVDTDEQESVPRHFVVAMTGEELGQWPASDQAMFIGTVQFASGALVAHIWEAVYP